MVHTFNVSTVQSFISQEHTAKIYTDTHDDHFNTDNVSSSSNNSYASVMVVWLNTTKLDSYPPSILGRRIV